MAAHGHYDFADRAFRESMYTLQEGAINAGFIFFALAILATLIFGRFVCGWGCHIICPADFCAWLLKKAGFAPKPFRSRLLVFVPLIAALYMFVWPTVSSINQSDGAPLIPEFSNHLVTNNFWQTFPSVAVAIPFLYLRLYDRLFPGLEGFCTYACPYGGFFGIADELRRENTCHGRLQSMWTLHSYLHFKRNGPRRGKTVWNGRRSRLHEVYGLHKRLSQRRFVFWFW